jgi:hypothetical protein
MSNPVQGFRGHGKLGVYYTPEQYAGLRQQEDRDMDVLLAAQRDGVSDGDEEVADMAQEARVSFGDSVQIVEGPEEQPEARAPNSERARTLLEGHTGGRRPTSNRKTPSLPDALHYGLVDPEGDRWVFEKLEYV